MFETVRHVFRGRNRERRNSVGRRGQCDDVAAAELWLLEIAHSVPFGPSASRSIVGHLNVLPADNVMKKLVLIGH